jgi:hypothetical protein
MRVIEGGKETTPRREVTLSLIRGGKTDMITTTRMIFKNETFKKAFAKLLQMDLKYDVAYKVQKLQNKLFDENKEIDKEAKIIVEQYTKKDADGKAVVKMDKDVPVGFEWENETEANEAFRKIYEVEIQIPLTKLFVHQLGDIKLSADEWRVMEFMIADAPKE